MNSIFFLLIVLAWIPTFGSTQGLLDELTNDLLARKHLTKTEEEIRKVFQDLDKDGDGFISVAELQAVMTNLQAWLTEEEIDDGIRSADISGDGLVDLEEFIDVTMHSQQYSKRITNSNFSVPLKNFE